MLWQTERVGAADMTPNQSLAGVLARLYDSIETPALLWLSFAMLVLALGLSRASSAHADGDELTAFTLVGLTTNVISPISWSHHLVWVRPGDHRARPTRDGPPPRARVAGCRCGVAPAPARPTASRRSGRRSGIRAHRAAARQSAALGLYLLFLISPIWPYEHRLPEVSHYAGRPLRRADGELARRSR